MGLDLVKNDFKDTVVQKAHVCELLKLLPVSLEWKDVRVMTGNDEIESLLSDN